MSTNKIKLKEIIYLKPPKNGEYYLIAIDGRAGSGKTSLSKYLNSILPEFSFLCGDDYFEPIQHPISWGGYNGERFARDIIKPLQDNKKTINYHAYDWDNEPHLKNLSLKITKGIFVDRVYSFSFEIDYDLKIWVETPRDLTIKRGIKRSSMPKDRAEKVWQELWKPMEDRYISQYHPDKKADIIIDGAKSYRDQIIT